MIDFCIFLVVPTIQSALHYRHILPVSLMHTHSYTDEVMCLVQGQEEAETIQITFRLQDNFSSHCNPKPQHNLQLEDIKSAILVETIRTFLTVDGCIEVMSTNQSKFKMRKEKRGVMEKTVCITFKYAPIHS